MTDLAAPLQCTFTFNNLLFGVDGSRVQHYGSATPHLAAAVNQLSVY